MSLISSLNIGANALAVQSAAIQTTGNNISNAGNADYTRQVAGLVPNRDQMISQGIFAGTGVQLESIQRQIDDALNGRLQSGVSEDQAAQAKQQWLGQVESVFNELSDADLSTQLSTFFNSWSNLANKPQDIGLRQIVLTNGDSVANWLQDVRGKLSALQAAVDQRIPALVKQADSLASQIADLNNQITSAEGGNGMANGLRDQRDAAVKQLATLVDLSTVEQPNGQLNVYIGSEPLVLGTSSRGLTLATTIVNGLPTPEVRFKQNQGTATLNGGQVGGLLDARASINGVVANVDGIANALIFDLNKIHSSGQGLDGFASATATNIVADATKALNDPLVDLKNAPTNGSFVVHVKDKQTGLVTSTLMQVDLDGLNGNDTTLNSLTGQLNGVAGVNASISAGKLTVAADSAAVELSFSQDSSGVLASLGVNNFFTGSDARDIAVSTTLKNNPKLLAAAKNGAAGDNQTARLIAGLETAPAAAFSGQSIKDRYQAVVNQIGTDAAAAKTASEATQGVLQTLEAQRESISGVSLDEEAVNLMREQRAYQGAARLITAVNDMMDAVLSMAR
jgi:flagellar hook-associated protein 1 FlgK